jgi:hypothetical protein
VKQVSGSSRRFPVPERAQRTQLKHGNKANRDNRRKQNDSRNK